MKKLIYLFFLFIAFSCGPKIEDVRQVKKGMTANELKYLMGEPRSISINADYEDWYFTYFVGVGRYQKTMCVEVAKDKVIDFYSY